MELTKRLEHFRFFSLGSLIYALFYTFCLYRNPSGITYPFFVGGTLFFFFLYLKKLQITVKRDSAFYMGSLILLGISTFCTDDGNILLLNKLGIFILLFAWMIHCLFQDSDWNLSKYTSAIFQTIIGSAACLGRPFTDLRLYLKQKEQDPELQESTGKKGKYILLGLLISVPALLLVILLLSTADVVFAYMLEEIFKGFRLPKNIWGVSFTILFSFMITYGIFSFFSKKSISESVPDRRTGEPLLAITVTAVLSVVYIIFCIIQAVYLFWGNLELPYGYTYAMYARQGFFQLLFVCLMNLALVLVCLGRFRESRILKTILTIISLCTYIMIASSAMRMILYIKYYYLTFLRLFVLWSLLVIFLLISGVLIQIYRPGFPLFRFSMVTVTTLYIILSFSHPDYWIAKCNISQLAAGEESSFFERVDGYSDMHYLLSLSADAAPILLDDSLSGNWEYQKYYNNWVKEKTEEMTLRSFNLSRFIASRNL